MRVIIAGGREYQDASLIQRAVVASGLRISEVVTGGARGIDTLAFDWSWENGFGPPTVFVADWNAHGRAAGPIRNEEMAEYADALIAIPGCGRGTHDMIRRARAHGLQVFVFEATLNGDNK